MMIKFDTKQLKNFIGFPKSISDSVGIVEACDSLLVGEFTLYFVEKRNFTVQCSAVSLALNLRQIIDDCTSKDNLGVVYIAENCAFYCKVIDNNLIFGDEDSVLSEFHFRVSFIEFYRGYRKFCRSIYEMLDESGWLLYVDGIMLQLNDWLPTDCTNTVCTNTIIT
jgi:hypothetical protein